MPVTNYYSVGGEILGEETGGVRRDYLTDALGSVTATVTGAGAIENTYRYKPYGAPLSKTGSGTDPAFTWVGKWGYLQTSKNYSDVYVRARNYASVLGRWISQDTIESRDGLFNYLSSSPVNHIDFTGNVIYVPSDFNGRSWRGAACGGGSSGAWFITALVNNNNSSGYAVQHVETQINVRDCSGRPVPDIIKDRTYNPSIWEGFKIPNIKDNPTQVIAYDIFNFVTRISNSKGCLKIVGRLKAVPDDFIRRNNMRTEVCINSRRLPCTTKTPLWPSKWVDFDLPIKYMHVKWDCCGSNKLFYDFYPAPPGQSGSGGDKDDINIYC